MGLVRIIVALVSLMRSTTNPYPFLGFRRWKWWFDSRDLMNQHWIIDGIMWKVKLKRRSVGNTTVALSAQGKPRSCISPPKRIKKELGPSREPLRRQLGTPQFPLGRRSDDGVSSTWFSPFHLIPSTRYCWFITFSLELQLLPLTLYCRTMLLSFKNLGLPMELSWAS